MVSFLFFIIFNKVRRDKFAYWCGSIAELTDKINTQKEIQIFFVLRECIDLTTYLDSWRT